MNIAVVTDSTAYIPSDLASKAPVRVLPLHVSVDGAEARDETDFGPRDLATALVGKRRVTTSGATFQELAQAYRDALASGADGVVSIHLSRRLSGTWDAARLAAEEVDPQRVRVVDSGSAGMGLGFSVLAAARSARAGQDLATVASVAGTVASRATVVFSVQTLDYLRRGGRISTTTAVLGTALAIKPLLHVKQGRIEPLEKVRTTARATARLAEITERTAAQGPVSVAVHHLAAPDRAAQLAERLVEVLPDCRDCVLSEVGAVVGAHIGPGAMGVVVLQGDWRDTGDR